MKKILAFLIIAFCSVQSQAQDPELFEHTWYLDKIVLENGDEHIPVPNEDVPFIALEFNDDDYFETTVCNNFFCNLVYDSNQFFTIQESTMTLIECDPFEHYNFEMTHFGFFLTETHDHIEAPFHYEITTDENDNKTLVITNERDDYAVYGNQQLSADEFADFKFSLYPNPASDILHIQNLETTAKAIVYDLNGRQIKTKNISATDRKINISQLQNGIYFLVLENPEGIRQAVKFVKK